VARVRYKVVLAEPVPDGVLVVAEFEDGITVRTIVRSRDELEQKLGDEYRRIRDWEERRCRARKQYAGLADELRGRGWEVEA